MSKTENAMRIQDEYRKQSIETPKYDIVAANARKYIIGGAAIFIPDLCEALKQDWYPRASYDEIKNIPDLHNQIKHKIYEDWDSHKTEDKSGWSYDTISKLLPDWLPNREWTEGSTAQKQTYQEYRFFMRLVRDPKKLKKLHDAVSLIPRAPSEPKEDKKGIKHREKLDTPEEIYKDSMNALGTIFERIFNYKGAPVPDIVDSRLIDASEKYRLRLLKGLGPMERKALIIQMECINMAAIGFLKHARDVLAQETRVDK